MSGPGLSRARSVPVSEIERLEQQLAELRRNAEQADPVAELCSRDLDRSKFHAAFNCAIEAVEFMHRMSRARIAAILDVHPVSLKDWIENGYKQRDQLPGWILPALMRLPPCAWDAFQRELLNWRAPQRMTGT